MEGLYSKTNSSSKDLFSDPSHRMPQRPYSVKSGEGVGFQELGSSFGRSKPINTIRKTYKSKSKPPRDLRKEPPPVEGESDDEILLSSSQPSESTKDDARSSPKRVDKAKKHDRFSDEVETILVNGHLFNAHPDYKPSSFDALKNLRFSKMVPAGNPTEDVPPPSSSLDLSQEISKPISDELEIVDTPSKPARKTSTRRRSPSATRNGARPFSDAKDPPAPIKNASRPSAKPHQEVCVLINRKPGNNRSAPRRAAQNRAFPLRSKTPEKPTIPEDEGTTKKPRPSSTSRREPQEFPMSLLAKENVSDSACSGDGSSVKTRKAGVPRSATFVHTPRPIPLPSPLRTKPVSRSTTFPNLSPLSSSMEKGKAPARELDELDTLTDGSRKQSGPRPFPMVLSGVGRRSTSPSSHSSRSTKRASSDNSETEQGRTAKKQKDSPPEIPELYDYLNEPMEDDSLDMGYPRDPSKVCPYCDEDLPAHPTPFFRHILATACKKSVSDPRPRNRGGLKAPLTIYASVCQRHRFESHQLPIAIKKGWPNTLDFAGVPTRVKKMSKELEAIILDKDGASGIGGPDTDEYKEPRSKSVFWREVKKEMKKQGSRTVMGVKGQFASFEKTQPGYYGEQGSVIIHQTLFDLFPPSSFDASLIAPLAPAEFIQRVLVPEAAVRLIAEDLSLNMKDALVTLRDSAQYGVAMFPDTGETKPKRGGSDDDDDEMGVADRIVMERARARRKELAEEERVENAMLEEERAAQRARAREIRREKAVERARQLKAREGKVDTDEFSETSEIGDVRRRSTRQQLTTPDSESGAMSVDGLAGRRATRVAKKGVQKKPVKAGGGAAQTEDPGSDSGSIEFVDDSTRKMNIKGHKAKGRGADLTTLIKKTRSTTSSERKKPFGGFASLEDEQDKTPRAGRQRKTDADATEGPVKLSARACPLGLARNRTGKSAPATRNPWSGSLLTHAPDDADSDASNTNRRSQRLIHPPIEKGDSFSWLLRGSQSSNDSP